MKSNYQNTNNVLNKVMKENDLLRFEDEEKEIFILSNDKTRKGYDVNNNLTQNNTSILENNNFAFIKTYCSYSFILPIAYFVTSITGTFILILMNCIKEANNGKIINRFPLHPFPAFYTLNSIQPLVSYVTIMAVAIIGLLNVWFYSSMLLQRFSVPELQAKKIGIHMMFIFGILANILYIFYGFSFDILKLELITIKDVRISLSTIIYLTFIFFNILFAVVSILSLDCLIKQSQNYSRESERMTRKIKVKRSVVYLAVFIMFVYMFSIALRNHEQIKENHHKQKTQFDHVLELILFILPYLLYIVNAFINLGYYSDIIYIQNNLTTIVDHEYFFSNEDNLHFFYKNLI